MLKQTLRNHLLKACSEQELRSWYDPLVLSHDAEGRSLEVRFPHAFFGPWFSGAAQTTFEQHLHSFMGEPVAVNYISPGTQPGKHNGSSNNQLEVPFGARFTFDSFIANRKNSFPLATAQDVAREGSAKGYNPFVICGGNGNGKTHLLRAIANEYARTHRGCQLFCGSVDDLASLYAVRFEGNTQAARQHLFACDALAIDDLQRLAGNQKLQQELVSVFDHFHDAGKQMVYACSGVISAHELGDALRSRLELGLIVELKEPDLDVRLRFIQNRCATASINLGRDQMLQLAQRFRELRHLSGILLKVVAFSSVVNRPINERDLEQIISHTEGTSGHALTPDEIIDTVALHFGVTPRDITGAKRQQNIVQARQVAMFLCRELLGSSFPALGRIFGGKDHSTAMYAVKKVKTLQQNDREAHTLVTALKKRCLTRDV